MSNKQGELDTQYTHSAYSLGSGITDAVVDAHPELKGQLEAQGWRKVRGGWIKSAPGGGALDDVESIGDLY